MTADLPAQTKKVSDARRFELLVRGVIDYAIVMLTPDGIVTSWNAGAHRIKGYDDDEAIGQHFSAFYSVDDRAAGLPDFALATALTEGKFEGEGWRIRKDGSRFWASEVIDPIRDESGYLVGFAKITRDITERRAAEDALRKSEEQFRLLVHGVSDYAIYMLSSAGLVNSWNAGAQRIKGYTEAEIVGKHFSAFYTPDDRVTGLPAHALGLARQHGKFEGEGWRVRKDGSRFWASVVIDALYDPAGDLMAFAKITRDISERKFAEESLHRSEQQFRLLVQGVTDYAIYMLSPLGIVTNWNAGARRIKGYEEHEIVGRHFSCFYSEADRKVDAPAVTLATAARDGRVAMEGWRIRRDGTPFWAHVVVDAIWSDTGDLVGYAKVTQDISERKEAAEALDRANTALVHSQKMEAVGQLTGGVAHDFNNLLSVISSSLQVLGTQSRSHLDAKMLDMMQRAVDRGAALTQQLLAFARQQPLKIEQLNLNTLIEQFEPMLRRAGLGPIALKIDLRAAQATVELDGPRFESALLNLVVNARDAMLDGGEIIVSTDDVILAAHAKGNLPPGAYVRIGVKDSGTGMPPDVVARAFEPFFTTKEMGKGTGLGLSQVYGFIAQSGGDTFIQTAEGRGTSIDMYLPSLLQLSENSDFFAAGPAVETVLIVEDEPDLLAAAAELFRSIGYDVVSAASAQAALDVLARQVSINIVFSDVMMPGEVSGIDLAHRIQETYPGIKVVLVSGVPPTVLRRQYGDIGSFTFIPKPYRLSEVARALRS